MVLFAKDMFNVASVAAAALRERYGGARKGPKSAVREKPENGDSAR